MDIKQRLQDAIDAGRLPGQAMSAANVLAHDALKRIEQLEQDVECVSEDYDDLRTKLTTLESQLDGVIKTLRQVRRAAGEDS